MESIKRLLKLAEEQQTIFRNLLQNLFDKSIEGISETLREVDDLRTRHQIYHLNIYQIYNLKTTIIEIQKRYDSMIQSILNKIAEKKQYAKQLFENALNQLEKAIDKREIIGYFGELIKAIDDLVQDISHGIFLMSIFSVIGIFPIIAGIIALFGGQMALGVFTLGIGTLVTGTASEVLFRTKLSSLHDLLAADVKKVNHRKTEQIKYLEGYFQDFSTKLQNAYQNQTSKTNVVWCDKNIENDENQKHLGPLREVCPIDKYTVLEFDNPSKSIEWIESNTENNTILITSGSDGDKIISKVGGYFHVKGIIVYCSAVEYHRTWALKYKKVLLATNQFSQVIQKIQDIETGEIYFLAFGFSFEDITLKLKDYTYYLSTKQNGFIIEKFADLKLDKDYHIAIMMKLYESLKSKKFFSNGVPDHFEHTNLINCAEKFVAALNDVKPEINIIRLYTASEPFYYKIVNDILNSLDEDLILLIQDYIKALRYSLLIYSDSSNKVPNKTSVKLYRCLRLEENKFEQFLKKFRIEDRIVFPSFLSTSLDPDVAKRFIGTKGVKLEISADCTKPNRPKCISQASEFNSEDEVLLNCFSILTVKKITKKNDNSMLYECNLEL